MSQNKNKISYFNNESLNLSKEIVNLTPRE